MYEFIDAHTQTFWHDSQESHDDDSPIVRHFSLIPTTDHPTSIDVVASTQDTFLYLSYFVNQEDATRQTFDKLIRADFLWEKTCLECFFDFGQEGYFELNFTPTGEYNLYRFDSYRMPDTMPPVWAQGKLDIVNGINVDGYTVYHLSVQLDDGIMDNLYNINPTAIIYHGDTPSFYAVRHASPPDFHNKDFWQEF